MSFSTIAVLGLGKVGRLVADLLHQSGCRVIGLDARPPTDPLPYPVRAFQADDNAAAAPWMGEVEAVVSCLPYALNLALAQLAHRAGVHWFDLTEDVPTTQAIRGLSATARAVLAPQCGLAPGFVGIVGASLAQELERCRALRLRVGALPRHPSGLLGYAFNWSPEGVVNEYLNDCEVIEEGVRKYVSAMEWIETLYVDGVKLEAFTTSGGLGTMCETFLGRIANLDYKTLRYPGHVDLMNFFFHELLLRERRDLAGEILTHAKPPVADDVVYVHISAEGTRDGRLVRDEFVRAYRPRRLADRHRTAIAWTTAASVVAVVQLVRDGVLPDRGFLRQEDVPLGPYLATPTGRLFDEGPAPGSAAAQ